MSGLLDASELFSARSGFIHVNYRTYGRGHLCPGHAEMMIRFRFAYGLSCDWEGDHASNIPSTKQTHPPRKALPGSMKEKYSMD